MRIALLGATSQIARDVVLAFSADGGHELALFARRPDAVVQWLGDQGLAGRHEVADFAAFGPQRRFDAVLNFVGVGNPAVTAALGASILDTTAQFDELALSNVRGNPGTRYVFLSSGAAYGAGFERPADETTEARVPINRLGAQDWYAAAKMMAEVRHRALADLAIVDLRVFNYFSHRQDLSARFLVTDIVRALRSGETLRTNGLDVVRDFLGPEDFHQLLSLALAAPPRNEAYDCYTRAPVAKFALLQAMQQRFGLRYEVDQVALPNATGAKPHYYSTNRRAEALGYRPARTALETVLDETALCL